jgi:hypothetical protein
MISFQEIALPPASLYAAAFVLYVADRPIASFYSAAKLGDYVGQSLGEVQISDRDNPKFRYTMRPLFGRLSGHWIMCEAVPPASPASFDDLPH